MHSWLTLIVVMQYLLNYHATLFLPWMFSVDQHVLHDMVWIWWVPRYESTQLWVWAPSFGFGHLAFVMSLPSVHPFGGSHIPDLFNVSHPTDVPHMPDLFKVLHPSDGSHMPDLFSVLHPSDGSPHTWPVQCLTPYWCSPHTWPVQGLAPFWWFPDLFKVSVFGQGVRNIDLLKV